jgi:hypothetical protein
VTLVIRPDRFALDAFLSERLGATHLFLEDLIACGDERFLGAVVTEQLLDRQGDPNWLS